MGGWGLFQGKSPYLLLDLDWNQKPSDIYRCSRLYKMMFIESMYPKDKKRKCQYSRGNLYTLFRLLRIAPKREGDSILNIV